MSRLFWKFFICIWLAQLAGMLGIGATLWVHDQNRTRQAAMLDRGPPAVFVVEAAAQTLQHGGVVALQSLLQKSGPLLVYAVDDTGRDLLGRPVPAALLAQVRQASGSYSYEHPPALAQVTIGNNQRYTLFSTRHENGRHPPPPVPGEPHKDAPPWPWLPFGVTIIASLVCAVLLAWYFAKPIGALRSAFDALAQGRLDTRMAGSMAKRRDELADLGRNFDHMAEQLQALVENQRRLLHDVSHEMRSPLARLQAAIGLLRQQPDKTEASLARIERECVRMDELVGELLTLSRLEAAPEGSFAETVDVGHLLADLIDDARFEAESTGHQIVFSSIDHARVLGQPELLHRAIENVVRNALLHSPAGGRVRIGMNVSDQAQFLQVRIEDQGTGVAESELESIFEPFHRGEKNQNPEGHGLGLAIARRVIETHCGNIRASNRAEGGLCVDIFLPLQTNHA